MRELLSGDLDNGDIEHYRGAGVYFGIRKEDIEKLLETKLNVYVREDLTNGLIN